LEKGDEVAPRAASNQENVIAGLEKAAIEGALPAHQAREDRGLAAREVIPRGLDRFPQLVKPKRSRGEVHRRAAGAVERLGGAGEKGIRRLAPADHHAPDDTAGTKWRSHAGALALSYRRAPGDRKAGVEGKSG